MTPSSITNPQQRLFAVPAGGDDIYRNTALDMLASSVLQQVRNEEQIQVIKGESGLGKTTFCQRLLYEAPPDTSISFIAATKRTGIAEILGQIGSRNEPGNSAPLQLLAKSAAQKIYQQLYNNQQPVVLIDDAHYLSSQTLANLFRFQNAIAQQNTGGFKLILVGERKIDSRLEKVDKNVIDRDRFHSSLLRPLGRNQIGDYIEFKAARMQGEKPKLNKKQLQYVRSNSGGIPAKIEELCLRALQGKTFDKRHALAAVFALVLTAGGLAYHYRDSFMHSDKPVQIKPVPEAPFAQETVPEETAPPAAAESEPGTGQMPTEAGVEPADSLAWLSNQPAEFYLIQLMGSHDRAKMENYRRNLHLPHPLTLHSTDRNGQDWYLLFYGPFPDYESAMDAREQLPAELRSNQPWIRQIGSILEKQ